MFGLNVSKTSHFDYIHGFYKYINKGNINDNIYIF